MNDKPVVTDDIYAKLEIVAKYIVMTSAEETTTGNYVISAHDIPDVLISQELYSLYLPEIVKIMREYEAVDSIDISFCDSLDVCIYTDYCPNYEMDDDELEDFPEGRDILDPSSSRRVTDNKNTPTPAANLSLMARLEAGKQKAAEQNQTDAPKSKERRDIK